MSSTGLPELFARLPEAFADAFDAERPWDLLGDPLDRALDALPSERLATPIPPDVALVGDRIVIGRGVRLHPGVVLVGPVHVGDDCELRPGAFLRGGVWLEDGCVVGASTELKRAILLSGAKAPHLNYVGDSILGERCNLGAGTILSNFRHDGAQVVIPGPGGARLETGRRKLGAVLGDRVLTGCNDVLHPGVVMGRDSQIYPGVNLRPGVYPARTLVKLRQEIELVPMEER